MKLKLTEEEIYEVIIKGEHVFALVDIDKELTFRGHTGVIYQNNRLMELWGFKSLIGKMKICPFMLKDVKQYLVD